MSGPDEPGGRPDSAAGGGLPDGGRRRLVNTFLRPRVTKGAFAAALLCGVLGFAAVVQVRANQDEDLRGLRQSELIGILDNVSERSTRLQAEARELERTREQLTTGRDRAQAAVEESQARAETLGVLAGTLPAEGPGIELTIPDPDGQVEADVLLDAVQELRDAGAEAISVGPVRVVASTYFVEGDDGGVVVDGEELSPPYRMLVIGDAATLSSALDIPGGIMESLGSRGSDARVEQRESVEITALRPLSTPEYARPAPEATDDGG
jgi:uncharacterized protein YlxW (UPF0749 family)